jgi:hypothetical protein
VRFTIRALSEVGTRAVVGGTTVSLTPALLYGAGRAGAMMARSAKREPSAGVLPVGFLDSDRTKRGSTVAGLPVFGGLDRLDEAIARTGARMLLITLPNPSGKLIDHLGRARSGLEFAGEPAASSSWAWNGHAPAIPARDPRPRTGHDHAAEVADSIHDQVVR